MNWAVILTVLGKELRETLRDRRTLIIMIVVPVLLYPAMLVLMEQVTVFGRRALEADAVRVAVVGAPPEARAYLDADAAITTVAADSAPMAALRGAAVDAIVVFPAGGLSPETTSQVRLFYDGTRERSGYARGRVLSRLDRWSDTLLVARLAERGLAPDFAAPLRVEDTSIATAEQVGGWMLGRFLPMLLIVMTILGAFYPSIDLAAGEKERGTLEALLTVPVHADNLVIGKFAAAAIMGLTAATLNLGSMLLTFQSGIVQFGGMADIRFELPAHAVLVIFGVLALLAVLFSALFLGIAVRSHSFKEAQNALTPVYILSFLPALLPLMPGMSFDFFFAVVPVAGVAFLFRDLMSGGVEVGTAVIAVMATVLYTALALAFAARAFGREEVLFGTGAARTVPGGPGGWLRRRAAAATQIPAPGAALLLVAFCALLYFYLARPLFIRAGEDGILVAQLLFLALPALLFVMGGRYDPAATLALRLPSARGVGAALLIIAGGIPIAWLIGWLQSFVLEIPAEFLEAMRQLVTAEDARRLPWLLLILAVTPAVCEELVFRGVLLQGLGSKLSMRASVLASALIFGAFHLSFETAIRFLPTAWLGLLLGYVVWHTRSILTGMLMHLLNNGLIVVLVSLPALRGWFEDPAGSPPWIPIILAPFVLYAGVRMLPHREEMNEGR